MIIANAAQTVGARTKAGNKVARNMQTNPDQPKTKFICRDFVELREIK